MTSRSVKKVFTLALLGASLPSHAHTGHGLIADFSGGALHPLGGIDHLLIMLAVGLWAAHLGGRNLCLLPLAFLALMSTGAGLHQAGLVLPEAELAIQVSLLVVGAVLALRAGVGTVPAMVMVGFFALFHGAAHARELTPGEDFLAYGLGFLATTAALHGLGLLAGLLASRRLRSAIYPAFGLLCAGAGAGLLALG